MLRQLSLVILMICTSGCTSLIGFGADPAISSDHLDEGGEPNKLKGLKGDRRLVRTHRIGPFVDPKHGLSEPNDYEICVETQADAIGSRSPSESIKTIGLPDGNFENTGTLTEALSKTVERSAVSDVVRQLSWATCNAKMNRYIDAEQFYAEMQAIREGAFAALAKPTTPAP